MNAYVHIHICKFDKSLADLYALVYIHVYLYSSVYFDLFTGRTVEFIRMLFLSSHFTRIPYNPYIISLEGDLTMAHITWMRPQTQCPRSLPLPPRRSGAARSESFGKPRKLSESILYDTILYYTILYHTILYCIILYYIKLYYTILYYTVLYCTVLYYTILYYTILYYTILYYTMLYYTILYYTMLYYTILYYTILYYTILYYTILYYTNIQNGLHITVALFYSWYGIPKALQPVLNGQDSLFSSLTALKKSSHKPSCP